MKTKRKRQDVHTATPNLPVLAVAACLTAFGGQAALAASEIELFFPVPVDGQLARDMGRLIKRFNDAHPDIVATPVYTGSYDETLINTNASVIKAGKPPAAVMSANFLTDLVIEGQIQPFDDLIQSERQDRRPIHGAVLRGICIPTRSSTKRFTACRFRIRRRCFTTTRSSSRKRASTPTSRQNWDQLIAAARN